jgi:glucose-6-phosphate dehydrogenase assembly protein OpcA
VAPAPAANEAYILDAPDGSRPFDAEALEIDLRNMWKRVGGDSAPKAGAVYRAALANLIVPIDPAREAKLTPVLVDVTRSHPARLFTIQAGSAPRGSGLRARVGALCHRRESGGGLVCCEQVVVESDEQSTALIPSAIRSLLIGDLPTVLLDFHPGLGVPWISELMKMADLVLEDSCLKQAGKETEVWHFLEREGSGRVHDLAWARLTPWREILAELFDGKEYLPALGTIRKIEIGFTGEGYPPPPVWLLAGWLASRLGWTPQGGNRNGIMLRSAGGTVTLVMSGLGRGEGVLERIAIRSDEPHPLDLEIIHHGRDATAIITAGAPGGSGSARGPSRSTRREVPFGYREFAACIVGEIHRHAENRPLEDAARAAEALMRHWRDA